MWLIHFMTIMTYNSNGQDPLRLYVKDYLYNASYTCIQHICAYVYGGKAGKDMSVGTNVCLWTLTSAIPSHRVSCPTSVNI